MIEFLVQHEGKIYDFSSIVTDIETSFSLNDGCGKLSFDYVPSGVELSCGDIVRFQNNYNRNFYGRVFKVSGGKNDSVSITSYDQLRYGKTKDTIMINKETTSTVVRRMCNILGLNTGTIENTEYVLATDVQTSKTWLDMIYGSISDTLIGIGKKYRLTDEYGYITLKDIAGLQLNLILGDDSLCYDYEYSKSIDDNFYNVVKLGSENEKTGKQDTYVAMDSNSIKKYGKLQYYEKLDKNANSAQVKSKADALLKLYNAEVNTLKLSCLGDDRIREGVSFYGSIEDIKLNRRLIVKSVKHKYLPTHTMEVEVFV